MRFDNLTDAIGVLVVAGPKARELMARVSDEDFSSATFPWLTGREILVGLAPTKALRVNFVGELGWELHHPIEYQNHIFDRLMEAGEDLGLKPFGIRAMDSLRIEKSYRLVGTELSIEYAAYEFGLDRFVHPNKGDFIGRDALVRWRERGFANRFVTLEVHDVTDADPLGNNPIYANGRLVGRATGGNYGFRVQKSLALAMVDPAHAEPGTDLEMDILGTRHPVTVIPESPYDPEKTCDELRRCWSYAQAAADGAADEAQIVEALRTRAFPPVERRGPRPDMFIRGPAARSWSTPRRARSFMSAGDGFEYP